jgi:hypothetical protein
MDSEKEIIFHEQQKFDMWLRLLIYLLMAMLAGFIIFSLKFTDESSLDTTEMVLSMILGIGISLAIAVLFGLAKLETEIRQDGIYVRYFPFHIHFKRFAFDDLEQYYARQYKPILEYGGWGLRYSLRNGRAYNIIGNKGVQLVFKNGRKLLIGSQKADEFEQAIRSITAAGKV